MNIEFDDVFDKICSQVTELHHRWKIYREVYASTQEDLNLLNSYGSNFFHYTQFLILDNVALCFSKLTDPNSSGRGGTRLNLSLKQFHVHASENGEDELVAELKSKFEALKQDCEKFRLLRNKKIAHADLLHSFGLAEEELPGISQAYVENALSSLRDYMNTIQLHYRNSTTAYEHIIVKPMSGGDGVIAALRKASTVDKNT